MTRKRPYKLKVATVPERSVDKARVRASYATEANARKAARKALRQPEAFVDAAVLHKGSNGALTRLAETLNPWAPRTQRRLYS